MNLKIGTRGSKLARWQADYVAEILKGKFPHLEVEKKVIKTTGDKIRDAPLAKVGGKGIFVKEIDEAVERGEVSFAVHSMKDVPTEMLPQLHIAATPEREEVGDAFISQEYSEPEELPQGAVVGTSSLRRIAEFKNFRGDLKIRDLRGNVDTRLKKLQAGKYDAIVMAVAGLKRLGWGGRITQKLPPETFSPSIGQGAIAIVARKDSEVGGYLQEINHQPTMVKVRAERKLLEEMGGGCQVPLGAYTRVEGDELSIQVSLFSPGGSKRIDAQARGKTSEAEKLGRRVASELKAGGGEEIMAQVLGDVQ